MSRMVIEVVYNLLLNNENYHEKNIINHILATELYYLVVMKKTSTVNEQNTKAGKKYNLNELLVVVIHLEIKKGIDMKKFIFALMFVTTFLVTGCNEDENKKDQEQNKTERVDPAGGSYKFTPSKSY